MEVINEAVHCVIWLNGSRSSFACPVVEFLGHARGMEAEVLQRILDLGDAMESDAEIKSEAAFRELLKGRSEYCLDGSTTLAPFKIESVSLPSLLHDCRPVAELCGEEGRRYLKWRERMLKTPEEMEESPPEEITPYNDPVTAVCGVLAAAHGD